MLIVGTSGWQYRDWKGRFYLPGVSQLPYYASHFATVEVNNSFYRLPPRETFAQWRSAVPDDFVFALKMSRYLTHIKRLREPEEPVERFLSHASELGGTSGPVLLQLPPTLVFDAELLHAVLNAFLARVPVAIEPRHPTWDTAQARQVLEKHGAALCWADRLGRPVTPLWRTADFGYIRLHEGRATPHPRYGRAALLSWLDRATTTFGNAPVYVYFNNDHGGAAVHDASALIGLAERRDVPVARAA